MSLTEFTIRAAKPREKPYKLADSGGLYLLVQPGGSRLWRMKYRVDGKEKSLAFGSYPRVSLAKAREARGKAKDMLAEGKDPSVEKQRELAMAAIVRRQTFGLVAEEQLEYFERKGLAPATMRKHRWFLCHIPTLSESLVRAAAYKKCVGSLQPESWGAAIPRNERSR